MVHDNDKKSRPLAARGRAALNGADVGLRKAQALSVCEVTPLVLISLVRRPRQCLCAYHTVGMSL